MLEAHVVGRDEEVAMLSFTASVNWLFVCGGTESGFGVEGAGWEMKWLRCRRC